MKRLPDKNKNPFKVPESYFENNADRLLKLAQTEDLNTDNSVLRFIGKISPWLATAAVIIIGLFLPFPSSSNDSKIALEEIPDEAIEAYLVTEYGYDIREEVVLNSLNEQITEEDSEWLENNSTPDITEDLINREVDFHFDDFVL